MSFNFGADPIQSGGTLKQAAPGQHEARILGIVHLGMFEDEFQGKKKPAAPFVCALLELKSGEDEGGTNEDGTPIVVHKSFPLKKGDRAFLNSFMKAILSSEELRQYEAGVLEGGFEDFIGRPVLVEMEGGKKKNDDGTPAYTNVKSIVKMPPKLAKLCDELENEVGHVTLDDMTKEALYSVPPFEIYGKLELSVNYPGSKAEEVLEEIREENPDFGTKKAKDDDKEEDKPKAPPERKREDLDEDKEFS